MHRFTAAIVGVTLALGIGIAQAHDEKGNSAPGGTVTFASTDCASIVVP
jgi:hypothetical protein